VTGHRIDLSRESVADATTLLKFRHLLEREGLTKTIFERINLETAVGRGAECVIFCPRFQMRGTNLLFLHVSAYLAYPL